MKIENEAVSKQLQIKEAEETLEIQHINIKYDELAEIIKI